MGYLWVLLYGDVGMWFRPNAIGGGTASPFALSPVRQAAQEVLPGRRNTPVQLSRTADGAELVGLLSRWGLRGNPAMLPVAGHCRLRQFRPGSQLRSRRFVESLRHVQPTADGPWQNNATQIVGLLVPPNGQ